MPVDIACRCDDLPAHDHFLGHEIVNGVYQARWGHDSTEIGSIWVDWKEVARVVMTGASSPS